MRKVLMVASVQSHICQFHKPLAELLHNYGFEVHVAAHDNLSLKPGLQLDFADKVMEVPFSRSVTKVKENFAAYKAIKKIIDGEQYEAVHCNTPIASVIVRLAARKARKKGTKVIYTAHGFQFFRGSKKKDWIVYYPIERILSRWTDLILTINQEDYSRAQTFHAKHVAYIPGVGVNTAKFTDAEAKNIRGEFGLPSNAYLLLSVGELFPRKNHKVMIDAMKRLTDEPIYYIICGNGILADALKEQCRENGVEDRVIFAGYRRDIPQVMKACDLCVFPSVREGLGLAGIEAMAAGLPVVSSNINGILDYMIDGTTGYMCDPHNSDAFADAILKLYHDSDKCRKISMFNVEQAKRFDVENSIKAIEAGYRMVINLDETAKSG